MNNRTIKKLIIAIGIYLIRWAVRLFGPIWPKSHRSMAYDCFELLDRYYGQVVDPEDRVALLLQISTDEERVIIYQNVRDMVNIADRVKASAL